MIHRVEHGQSLELTLPEGRAGAAEWKVIFDAPAQGVLLLRPAEDRRRCVIEPAGGAMGLHLVVALDAAGTVVGSFRVSVEQPGAVLPDFSKPEPSHPSGTSWRRPGRGGPDVV